MKMKKQPSVHIILLNWNEEKFTSACIESLKKINYLNFKIILVDNGSKKESILKLRKKYEKEVIFIQNKTNLGFTGGNNVGIRKALSLGAEYILLLNNDTEVEQDFLSKLVDSIEKDKSIGVIGPKINYMDKKELIWSIGGKINKFTGNNKLLMNKKLDKTSDKGIIDVGYVSGCAILVPSRIFIKIGLLDENYFIYNEEVDFCLRVAQKLNLRSVCRLDSKIYHKVSLTNKKYSGFAEYYLTRNRPYFVKKHNSKIVYFFYLIYFFLIEVPLYTFFYLFFYGRIKPVKFFYLGIIDFFKGNMNKCKNYFG